MLTSSYNGHPVHLIESIDELSYIKSLVNPKVTIGIDSESDGLTWFVNNIAGVCISAGQSYAKKDYHGFYLPVRHVNYDKNLPIPEVINFVQELVDNNKSAWFNRAFDFQMLEQEGFKAPCIGHTHDVQCMAHLVLNEHMPSLKDYSAKYLKYEVIEFSSNNAEGGNFKTTDPRVSYVYAAQDPIITTLLGRQLWSQFPYIQKIYKLDNLTAEVMRRFMRDTELYLDKDSVQRLLRENADQLARTKAEIFQITGYQFRLTSNKDKADALCFSEDTEFLTQSGFKKYDDITDSDKVAQYNPNTNLIEFVIPEGRISRYSDKMYHINHRYTDICITPGHMMYARKYGEDYKLYPIEEFLTRERGFHILNTVTIPDEDITTQFEFFTYGRRKKHLKIPADAFIEFLGFWLGDGHVTISPYVKKDGSVHTTYKVGLTQSDCLKKSETVRYLLDLNERMGNVFRVSHRNGRYDFQCACKGFAEYLNTEWEHNGIKVIPDWALNMSPRQKHLFLDAFLRADGSWNGAHQYIACNPELLHRLQYMCQTSGRKCSIIKQKSNPGDIKEVCGIPLKHESKPMYAFTSVEGHNYSHIKPDDIEVISENTRVVCFQVPSSILVVRRNGKVSVCGNCRFVTLTKKTKGGQYKVDAETLEEIDHPLAKLLVEFARLEKERSSYLQKFVDFPNPFHVAYQVNNVPTGRFSSGASKGNPYFENINIQNIKKKEQFIYLIPDETIGWKASFSPEGAVGTVKCKTSLRDCFVPPEGYLWAAFDYASQEVAVISEYAHETNLIEPIKNGEDIHKYVATKMFGHYDPAHRSISKAITFASNYGGGAFTIARKLGVPQEEGQRLLDLYNKTLPNLTRWKEETQKQARKTGFVFTYMGRPRAVWPIYNNPAPGMKAFGDRTAINSPVQGFGGDLIRLVHCKLYKLFQTNPEFASNVLYACTVHDEIDFFIKPNYLKKASDIICDLMYFQPPGWEIGLRTAPGIGTRWSTCFDVDGISEDNKIIMNDYIGKDIPTLQAKFREEHPELFN